MDKKKNIGYIYKITNLINGKIYIGQTSKTIEQRWRQHISDCFNKHNYKYPLHNAIRKYGIENFKIEVIEQCSLNKLNEKEIYWISFYDSFNNGYNATLGGEGKRTYNLNEIEVINKYNELKTLTEVSKYFNCNVTVISEILKKHKINIVSAPEHCKEKGRIVYQYDLNNNLINTFNSLGEAGQWLVDNDIYKGKNPISAKNLLRVSLLRDNNIYESYFWKIDPDYTQEEKETYKESCKSKNKKIYIVEKDTCPICGNKKLKESKVCINCKDKKRKDENLKEREEKYNLSRDVLKQKIRNNSFTQIGKEYSVKDNTIRKWCKSYNLPYKSSEIKKYSDEEWKNI